MLWKAIPYQPLIGVQFSGTMHGLFFTIRCWYGAICLGSTLFLRLPQVICEIAVLVQACQMIHNPSDFQSTSYSSQLTQGLRKIYALTPRIHTADCILRLIVAPQYSFRITVFLHMAYSWPHYAGLNLNEIQTFSPSMLTTRAVPFQSNKKA